jgi:hypothetical protein
MNNALKDLVQCGDVGSLDSALRTLCAEFGSVSQLDILTMTDAGKRHAVCLLRLDSSEHEQNLMTKLGAGRFGEDLCVVVDLSMPAQAQAQA